jgi:hypothetical protein
MCARDAQQQAAEQDVREAKGKSGKVRTGHGLNCMHFCAGRKQSVFQGSAELFRPFTLSLSKGAFKQIDFV